MTTADADKPNLSQAMTNADAAAAADTDTSRELVDAVQKGVAAQAKVFNTHSSALVGRLRAEEASLREVVADIDAQIATLNDQRTDAMLAYSGVSHALTAIERGR